MPRLRLLTLTAFMLLGGVVSCVGILGFERLHEDGGFELEASTDATDENVVGPSDAGDSGNPACGVIGIPGLPTDAGTGIVPPVLIALKTLDFGVDLDGGIPNIPGFNLDLTCSVDLATSSCTTTALESTFDRDAKDKNANGLDNSGYSLVEYITGFSDLLAASTINKGIADGLYGGVVRVSNWNGTPDDDDVLVEVFPAIAFAQTDGGAGKPSFNADDRWILDTRFLVAPLAVASTVKTEQAWVTGGQLVGRFKTATVPIKISDDPKPFDITVEDAVMQGTLVTANGLTSFTDATFAGRWKTADFLGQLRTIFVKDANNLKNTTLCEPAAALIYGAVKSEVCDARDIRSDSQDTAKLPCDAVSASLRVQGYGITDLGTFDAGPVIPARCASDADVPLNDDCVPN